MDAISNDMVYFDRRLSYRARGLYLELCGCPEGSYLSIDDLSVGGKEGKQAIRAALEELSELGYARRHRYYVTPEEASTGWQSEGLYWGWKLDPNGGL